MTNGSGRMLRLDWAGLAAGPTAWAINTQLAYAVAPFACGIRLAILIPVATVLAVVALIGALLSWRSLHAGQSEADWTWHAGGNTGRFLAAIGAASGLLFAFVIANQIAAILLLGGCWQ